MRAPICVLAAVALAGCGRPADPPSPAAAAATSSPSPSPSPLPDPLPEVVARVNGREIPLRFLRLLAEEQLRGKTASPAERATAYRRATEQLVSRELMLQEAQRRGIEAEDAKVQKACDEFRAGFPTEAAWNEWLAGHGLDMKTFRDELAVRHTVEALMRKVGDEAPTEVSEADARAYFEANPGLFAVAGRPGTFAEARPRAEAQLRAFRRQEALDGMVRRLRGEARVEIHL